MKKHSIHLLPDDIQLQAEDGALISKVLQEAGITMTLPCGGRGTCGRCIVTADGKPVKACATAVHKDMEIQVPDSVRLAGQRVLTDLRLYDPAKNQLPRMEIIHLELPEPTLDDSASDAVRLRRGLAERLGYPVSQVNIELSCLVKLPHVLRKNQFKINVTVVYENNGVTVLSLEEEILYGIAVDIGTTTIVTALCDLGTGFVMDTEGISNPQAEYGSDVISRIVYTEEDVFGLKTLHDEVIRAISDSILALGERNGIQTKRIPIMTIAANTVMTHFLLNLPADYLRREPYVPGATEFPQIRPAQMGFPIMPRGRVEVLPCISSYVGGDIVAGVIAADLAGKSGLHLLVDVGTNGEMVLSGEGFMIACSCSAGPAFEGSGISCGSRAVRGAIDNVRLENDQIHLDVIGGGQTEPRSLCGSGLIALLAVLLEKGIINRSGRFTGQEKIYHLTENVSITEADVLNLIRAKGSIYAGIRVLTRHMEIQMEDLEHVYIAGGFGRSININSAAEIGMFPSLGEKSYSYVGNSSLAGALRVLNDRTINTVDVANGIFNLELSVGNEFMDEFTKACFLPHTELLFHTN